MKNQFHQVKKCRFDGQILGIFMKNIKSDIKEFPSDKPKFRPFPIAAIKNNGFASSLI